METISRKDFREIIGWNQSNYPYSTSGLSYINELSGAEIKGAKIGENNYNLYYKYDVIKDIIHFPIIISSGDKCFIATNKNDLINFVKNPTLDKKFEAKAEKMPDCDYKKIRQHEIAFSNRIPYDELYNWDKEEFYGYRYVEF